MIFRTSCYFTWFTLSLLQSLKEAIDGGMSRPDKRVKDWRIDQLNGVPSQLEYYVKSVCVQQVPFG